MLNNRQEVIDLFKKGFFQYIDGFQNKEESEEESEEESKEKKLEKIKNDFKKFIEYIENDSKSIKYHLFKDFDLVVPRALAKKIIRDKK